MAVQPVRCVCVYVSVSEHFTVYGILAADLPACDDVVDIASLSQWLCTACVNLRRFD